MRLPCMANTFYALMDLADLSVSAEPKKEETQPSEPPPPPKTGTDKERDLHPRPSLHYNIQIHLPATKDVEVFNAIFKALKGHLLE